MRVFFKSVYLQNYTKKRMYKFEKIWIYDDEVRANETIITKTSNAPNAEKEYIT